MPETDTATAKFRNRILEDWLATYCDAPERRYDRLGFREASVQVAEIDAHDCMRAIDGRLIVDGGGGRYTAARSSAREVLFWEGHKTKTPRTITLWLEPVITFATLARLHFDYGWPKDLLGTQPKTWAFDVAAHSPVDPARYQILGEVKKTVVEAEALIEDLLSLSGGASADSVRPNSLKKWNGLLLSRPPIAWIIGSGGFSKAFTVCYPDTANLRLSSAVASVLKCPVHRDGEPGRL